MGGGDGRRLATSDPRLYWHAGTTPGEKANKYYFLYVFFEQSPSANATKIMSMRCRHTFLQVAILGLWLQAGAAFSMRTRMVHASTSSEPRSSSRLASIADLRSSYELADFTHQDDLAVVCFHSNWCKACQKFQLLYRRLDASNPCGVRLASVEYSKNTALSKSLGVVKLPTIQFYYRGSQLESFSSGPKSFPRVLGTIQCLLDEIEAKHLDEGNALIQSELGRHLEEQALAASPSLPSYAPLYSATGTAGSNSP